VVCVRKIQAKYGRWPCPYPKVNIGIYSYIHPRTPCCPGSFQADAGGHYRARSAEFPSYTPGSDRGVALPLEHTQQGLKRGGAAHAWGLIRPFVNSSKPGAAPPVARRLRKPPVPIGFAAAVIVVHARSVRRFGFLSGRRIAYFHKLNASPPRGIMSMNAKGAPRSVTLYLAAAFCCS
jgi:hypothetical protein